jgi:bacterioferritin
MKGAPEVVTLLNEAVGLEATLNEQYRLDSRSIKYLGLKGLKKKYEAFGDDVSNWRRDLLDRVYFLGGTPTYTVNSPTERLTVTDLFTMTHDFEVNICTIFEKDIQVAMRALDDNTRNMFEHFIKWHQDQHISWFEKQLRLIGAIGEAEYISARVVK